MKDPIFSTNLNKKVITVHSDRHEHKYTFLIDGVEHTYSKKIGQMILLFLQKIASSEKVDTPGPIPEDV